MAEDMPAERRPASKTGSSQWAMNGASAGARYDPNTARNRPATRRCPGLRVHAQAHAELEQARERAGRWQPTDRLHDAELAFASIMRTMRKTAPRPA